MSAIVIYDSLYGNTEQIAKAIADGFGGETKVVRVGDVRAEDIAPYHFVIIGSPTQGGRQTAPVKEFVDKLTGETLKEKRLAAFDTRVKSTWVKIFGYAAPRIEAAIKAKGGNVTAQPQGFFVKSTKGPLLEGELARATNWGKSVAAGVPTGRMPGGYQFKQKE
jgi:flavodoxin